MYRTCTALVKFTPKHFILFDDTVTSHLMNFIFGLFIASKEKYI